MLNASWNKPKVAIPFYGGVMFAIVAVLLFILGGVIYRREHPKEVNYKEDICLVLKLGYRNYTCRTRYAKFNCYSAAWDVQLSRQPSINTTAESETKYRSIDEALKKTNECPINTRASCWYDTRQPTVAQWKKPSARLARILLINGGLSTFMLLLCVFLSFCIFSHDGRGLYMSPRM